MKLTKPSYDWKNELVVKEFSEIPDEELLKQTQNPHQVRFLLRWREMNALAAKALKSKYTGENDPLAELEQKGEIDKFTKDRAWLLARWYDALWSLVQQVEPLLRRDPKKLEIAPPFSSALDLFIKLVRSNADLQFSLMAKPYVQLSSSKSSAQNAVAAKSLQGEELTRKEKSLIPKVSKEEVSKDWLAGVVAYAAIKATNKRPALKAAYRDYCYTFGDIAESNAKEVKKCPSIVLEYGIVTKMGVKEGGNYV